MKRKAVIGAIALPILLIVVGIYVLSGNSEEPSACSETVSITGRCQAYFARYYYSADDNTCKIAAGSGCSAEGGFTTASDCIRACGDNETTAEDNPLTPQESTTSNS